VGRERKERELFGYVVSAGTGECLCELRDGDRVLLKGGKGKKKPVDAVLPEGCVPNAGGKHTKVYTDELEAVLPELGLYERVLLLQMMPYVAYRDCRLRYRNGKPVSTYGNCSVFGVGYVMSDRVFRRTLKQLRDKLLISVGLGKEAGKVFVNPWLMSNGRLVLESTLSLFGDYKVRSRDGVLSSELVSDMQKTELDGVYGFEMEEVSLSTSGRSESDGE